MTMNGSPSFDSEFTFNPKRMIIIAFAMFVFGAAAALVTERVALGCSPFLCSATGGHCVNNVCVH